MSKSTNNRGYGYPHYYRSSSDDLELWKHFASFGGEDKNRMVTIVIWILGVSISIISYTGSHLIGNISSEPKCQPKELLVPLTITGVLISLIGAYVSLVYGGYANRNWEKANQIARERGWTDLLTKFDNNKKNNICQDLLDIFNILFWCKRKDKLNILAQKLAHPCEPQKRLPFICEVFFLISMFLFILHCLLLLLMIFFMK